MNALFDHAMRAIAKFEKIKEGTMTGNRTELKLFCLSLKVNNYAQFCRLPLTSCEKVNTRSQLPINMLPLTAVIIEE